MSFVTASQIALCTAMLLGIIALSTLLWRICTKPEYLYVYFIVLHLLSNPNLQN